jgi:glycosyltransferase involved in cell wall biosynthesis
MPRGYDAIERFAVRHADRTVVMSSTATQRLQSESDRVILGRNWFDGADFHSMEPRTSEELRIGWAGRLEPPKDPLRAVAVLSTLRSRQVPFSAWFAGSGTLESRLRRAIAEAGLVGCVEFLGPLPPGRLADELRASTVFLMTSLWEGFPRMAVEALACGVPLVTTNVGELSDLVHGGVSGFVSETREPTELAELLIASQRLTPGSTVADTVRHLEARVVVPDLFRQLASE